MLQEGRMGGLERNRLNQIIDSLQEVIEVDRELATLVPKQAWTRIRI
jgi:hypothetical protein